MAFNILTMVAKLGLDKKEFDNGLKDSKEEASSLGDKLKTAFKVVATGAAVKELAAFTKQSIQTGMAFDSAMSQVAATMGTTVDQIGELREYAQKMGSETAFSASQAADAMNILAMAGYNAEETIATLPSVLDMAAAGGLSIAEAADYATGIIAGFSNETLDAATIADKLATISTKAKGDVRSFGEGLSTVAGMANTTGQSMQDMTVALGILGNNNIAASEAGNALSRTLKNLYQATDSSKKQLAALGVSAYTATGEARPLQDVLKDLNKALDGMTDAKKNDILGNIFDAATLKSVPALLNNAGEAWDNLDKELSGSTGKAAEMAATQLDNLKGKITIMKSAIEGLQIAVSDKLSPSLQKGVEGFTNFISAITGGMREGNLKEVGIDMIRKMGEGFVEGIPTFLSEVLPNLLTMSEGLREGAGQFVDAGIDFILNLGKGIMNGLPQILEYVPQIISNLAGVINDNMPKILAAGWQLVETFGHGIYNAWPALVANFGNILKAIVDVIQAINWLALGSKIVNLLVNGVQALAASLPNALKSIATQGMNAIKQIDWLSVGKAIIDGIVAGIKSLGKNVLGALSDTIMGAVDGVKGILKINSPSKLFRDQIGVSIPEGIAEGIKKGSDSIFDAMSDIPTTVQAGYDSGIRNEPTGGIKASGDSDLSKVIELLEKIAEGTSISLEGGAEEIFRVVRKQNRKFTYATGYEAL